MKLFAYKAHTADLARRSGKITSSCIKLYRIAKMMLSMLILCCVHQMITRYSVISALGKNIGHVGEFSDVYELPPYCKCFYMYYFWSESDKLFHEIKFHACRYKHVYQLLLYGFYSFSLRFACFFSLCTLLIFCSNYLLHSKHILVFTPNVILTFVPTLWTLHRRWNNVVCVQDMVWYSPNSQSTKKYVFQFSLP